MTGEGLGQVSFEAHVELLQLFLTHRADIVERIEGLLNAHRKPVQFLQDRSLLSRHFEDCFFALAALTDAQVRLRGELEEAHWASGFRPRLVPELHNDLVHPAEMMRRAFHCWQQTRWPGRNGRVRFAHTLFNLYLIRCLELLSMRLWDAGPGRAGERLSKAQAVLDRLWTTSPADQPVLLRDARWLIPLAQSPTTDELAAYLEVAKRVAETLSDEDRIEIQKAHVQMIGGHLRSQIRHYCLQDGVPLDEKSVVLRTRASNALDFSLLIQHLVPLLEAYERAAHGGDEPRRLELAGAVFQAVSADPELFLNRIDLLGAYSMMEHLFVTAHRDGSVAYTEMGQRHARMVREYEALIGRTAEPLSRDCPRFRPVAGSYSPYGVIFGTPSNLTEHMAFKTIQRDAATHLGMEGVLVDGGADKIAWVDGWRKLPHVPADVQAQHEYPQKFAEEIFTRIEHELRRGVSQAETQETYRTGRLFVPSEDGLSTGAKAASVPDLAAEHIGSSDVQIVAASKAHFYDQARLLRDRQEGYFVVSYETAGGWVAVKKDMFTEVLGAGRDVKLVGLPPTALAAVKLLYADLVVAEDAARSDQASVPPSIVKA